MSEEESSPLKSLPISAAQLGLVYVAGIALNLVALLFAVRRGQTLVAGTLVLIIVYLVVRSWILQRS